MLLRVVLLLSLMLSQGRGFCGDLDEAEEKYALAEKSTIRSQKEELFNEALKIFLSYAKKDPSGALLYNVGTLYAQLGDYGSALAFFRRAEKLIPRDSALKANIDRVLGLANVRGYQIEYPFLDAVCFRWLSGLERKLILLGGIVFSLLFFSLNLWLPYAGLKWVSRFFISCTLMLFILIHSYQYLVPVRGVVIKATVLRVTEQSSSEAKLTLFPGEMVKILSIAEDKGPIRVVTSASVTGFLPWNSITVVE